MCKPEAVYKDVSTCFYLAITIQTITIQTLGALYREKALSVLPNKNMVKDSSSGI